jgi:colanic acid biosynthesis glycosyl transferase WcaI
MAGSTTGIGVDFGYAKNVMVSVCYGSFSAAAVAALIAVPRPDVLFVESPPLTLGPTAWLLSRIWRRPFVFNVADLWPDSIRDLGAITDERVLKALERLENWTYRKSAGVVAVTEGIRSRLTEVKNVPTSKVMFLPNGADIAMFQPGDRMAARRAFNLGTGPVLAYAGTVGLAQGLAVAVKAMEVVVRRHPTATLCIAGGGAELEQLQALAVRLHLGDAVRFLGTIPVEDVATLYQAADIGVVTLKDIPLLEGARPSKMLPMMAAGLPIAFSGRGEGPALLAEARGGCSSPPEDTAALSELLLQMLADPIALARYREQGRRFVEANYSWASVIERFFGELTTLLGAEHSERRTARSGSGRVNR